MPKKSITTDWMTFAGMVGNPPSCRNRSLRKWITMTGITPPGGKANGYKPNPLAECPNGLGRGDGNRLIRPAQDVPEVGQPEQQR